MDEDGKYRLTIDKRHVKIGVLIALITIGAAAAYIGFGLKSGSAEASELSKAVPATLDEVYPLFMCPCCGKPLDPKNICCDLAKERIDYISTLRDSGISNEEIVLTTAKKYGVNTLVNDSMKEAVRKELSRRAPNDRPKILVTPAVYDFGDVSISKGKVSTTMTVKNNGKTDLVIENIETSCMCTTAVLINNGAESPLYSMNMNDGNHPTGWKGTIPPGEEAALRVSYDPTMHSDQRGPLTRTITIYSNDPVDPQKEARIDANQVD